MNKILEFIRKHSKITVILIILCSLLPLIIVHILFKWKSGIAFLVAEWSAGELLGYIGTLLSFWGTIILGWLALQASNKANELSRRVIELEQDHYRLEMRPFVLVSNWKAYEVDSRELVNDPKKKFIQIGSHKGEKVLGLSIELTNTTESVITVQYNCGTARTRDLCWGNAAVNQENLKMTLSPGEKDEFVFYASSNFMEKQVGQRISIELILENRFSKRYKESFTIIITSFSVKNLIGRAGRSTAKPIFDFGSVILRPNAMSRFRKVYQKKNILSSKSRLDITDDKMDEKYEEYKEAIKTGEFSDEYNLTNKDLEKLKSDSVTTVVPTLLDMMFTGADFVLPNAVAKEVYEDFQCLYKQYLGRELTAAEKYVFDSAIKIMIWKVHGKTFSKICQERYAYVSNVAQRRFLAKAGQQNRADNLPVRYIAGYSDIPDKELRAYPLFPVGTKGKDVDYDRIVYDTYDFLDKLIGFKLSDLFYAIFHQYYLAYQDNRAERLAKYIKYGTEDSTEIWMLRYGFSFEEIEWLKPCVESIDQTEIRFNGEIESLDDFQRSSIAQYLF